MNKSLVLTAICVALLGGCVTTPPPSPYRFPDPSDPAAPQGSTRPLRTNLVATTKLYLDPSIGQEAQKMEHGNMQGMEGMQGMDHSKMPGMEKQQQSAEPSGTQPGRTQEMDHSKMSGMEAQQQGSPAPTQQPGGMEGMDHSKMPAMSSPPPKKEALEKEIKRTSDEMKKLSDELKERVDEASQERPSPSPQK
jgi:hypothetical protein